MSLHEAVKAGDKSGITYALSAGYISKGEDINSEIFDSTTPTALGWAMENKQYDTAKFLIELGANLPSLEHTNLYKTALLEGSDALAELLLEKIGYQGLTTALETEPFAWSKDSEKPHLIKMLTEKYPEHIPTPPSLDLSTIDGEGSNLVQMIDEHVYHTNYIGYLD